MTNKDTGWHKFLVLCNEVDSLEQLNDLFDVVFTIEEKQTFALRVELIQELLAGKKTQRAIARDLKISIAKITRGSNALKTISAAIKEYLHNHLVEEQKE